MGVLSCNSVGLNELVPVVVGGGVGGDNRRNMRPRFLNDCTRTDVANCVEVSQTLKTHTSSAAPKGTSSDMRGTSSSYRKCKPQPQLDSYRFQIQREFDARNVRTRCSTSCTNTTASGFEYEVASTRDSRMKTRRV
ncbi:hypothetical protein Tco_0573333 [Tanacetum coccineum]